jgi:uncharacterized membrane-anchored protein
MLAIFGAMATDVLHVGLDILYLVSILFFSVMFAAIFVAWDMSEKRR